MVICRRKAPKHREESRCGTQECVRYGLRQGPFSLIAAGESLSFSRFLLFAFNKSPERFRFRVLNLWHVHICIGMQCAARNW